MLKKLAAIVTKALTPSDISVSGKLYMRRWRFGSDNTFGVRLHEIIRSDMDRELHDHPFDFVSIILSGGYYEVREDGSIKWYPAGSVLLREAETAHRLIVPAPTWTLVIRSPYRRTWGFYAKQGWVPWHSFLD